MEKLRDLAFAGAFAALALCLVVSGSPGQAAGGAATGGAPATLTLGAAPRGGGNIYLDLALKSYRPPAKGAVEAVVTLGVAGGVPTGVEVARFAVFPHQPFEARDATDERGYRFNVTQALTALRPGDRPLAVQVHLLPIDAASSVDGAVMTFSRAALSSE